MKKPTLRQLMGVALRNARLEKKLTLAAVASLVNEKYGSNWGKVNVSDIELGKSASPETWEKLMDVLGFEAADNLLNPIELSLNL